MNQEADTCKTSSQCHVDTFLFEIKVFLFCPRHIYHIFWFYSRSPSVIVSSRVQVCQEMIKRCSGGLGFILRDYVSWGAKKKKKKAPSCRHESTYSIIIPHKSCNYASICHVPEPRLCARHLRGSRAGAHIYICLLLVCIRASKSYFGKPFGMFWISRLTRLSITHR